MALKNGATSFTPGFSSGIASISIGISIPTLLTFLAVVVVLFAIQKFFR